MKSEGVKDVFEWLDKKCKHQKKILDDVIAKKENGDFYYYDDKGNPIIMEEQVRLDTLVSVKISVEKYMKKLKHNGE